MTDFPALQSKVAITGEIEALTGLHIGGSSVGMQIGGADSVVVRDPLSNRPYIPGSSLRGKMRSLLERVRGHEDQAEEGGFSISRRGEALAGTRPETLLGQLFGVAAEDSSRGMTRLLVRDAPLANPGHLEKAPNTDMPLTEVKTEVWIDRITSQANPRQLERVPAGARFALELVVNVLEGDDRDRFLARVFEGLRLVTADTLGGNGARGYGRVRFHLDDLTERTAVDYREGSNGASLADRIPGDLHREARQGDATAVKAG